jgi:hypothetical protein
MTSTSEKRRAYLQSSRRWVVKRGEQYLTFGFVRDGFGPYFSKHQRNAVKTPIREDAEIGAEKSGGRVVRLVPRKL